MTLFFASCDCAGKLKLSSSGKHLAGCPMDTNCIYCGQKPFLCRMMAKCAGIQKTGKHTQAKEDGLMQKKLEILEVFKKLGDELKRFFGWSPFSGELIKRISELKHKFDVFKRKPTVTVDDIQQIENVLFKMRRICNEQKALYDKQQAAALRQATSTCEDSELPTRSE